MTRLVLPWVFALLLGTLPAAQAQQSWGSLSPPDADGPATLCAATSEPGTLPPPAPLPPPPSLPDPSITPSAPAGQPPTPSPCDPCAGEANALRTHPTYWPELWGFTGLSVVASGNKMAPNGKVYNPLGTVNLDFNVGLLPQKKLYLFGLGTFWAQKPTGGVTNPSQGNFDFSKRQFDFTLGAAWNYWGPFEARVFAYSFNNLNRGFDLNVPFGYNDGFAIENRFYFSGTNIYDLPRLNLLSIGYYPTKDMIGADGQTFHPGLFLRAYLTYEFVPRQYYVYADTEMISEKAVSPRLLLFDDGFAARPFTRINGLEFRLGVYDTVDVRVDNVRTLLYFVAQVLF